MSTNSSSWATGLSYYASTAWYRTRKIAGGLISLAAIAVITDGATRTDVLGALFKLALTLIALAVIGKLFARS